MKECSTAFGPMPQLSCSVMTADTLPAHVLIPGIGVTLACENLYDEVELEWAL